MAFRDLFVPKLAHSNPDVRKAAVLKEKDKGLLRQVIDKDKDAQVVEAAKQRLQELTV